MWYLQFHFVCDRLVQTLLNVLPLLSYAVGRPRSHFSKGSFSVYIIA